jgi:hypothetical protein
MLQGEKMELTKTEKIFAIIFRGLLREFPSVKEPDLIKLSEKLAKQIDKVI